jgi:hypothetical protein
MKIVIRTQFMENYGAHDWDGEGACPQRWKAKGGELYVYEGWNWSDAACGALKPLVEKLIAELSHSDEYSREYVIGWSYEEDDFVVNEGCEWETPVMIQYDAENKLVATRTEVRGEGSYWTPGYMSKTEMWVINGGCIQEGSYSCEWEKDQAVIDEYELSDKVAAEYA